MIWEYKHRTGHKLLDAEAMNEMGKEGWELVTVVPEIQALSSMGGVTHFTSIFKRAKETT